MLIERKFPGATTCIVVGGMPPQADRRLATYAHVAWIVDASNRLPQTQGVLVGRLEQVALETLTPEALPFWIDHFVARNPRRLPSLYVNDQITTAQSLYSDVLTTLHRALDEHHRARVTRQQDGFTWQRHVLENLSQYVDHRLPAAWAGALKGLPAYVCGAGPSLDYSAPHLARVVEHGVVFAADSALRALAKHGVTADFVVSVDAAKLPEKCLPPPPHSPARLILSAVSPPAWDRALPHAQKIFLSSNQITLDSLATHGIARTAIGAQENCGATGLELARHLGCEPIYLFGLDLALDETQASPRHTAAADASTYVNSGFDAAQSFPRIPGNTAPTVPTHVLADWHVLDQRLATWPEKRVFNVTDRGARLGNTTVIAPAQLQVAATSRKMDALSTLQPPMPSPSKNPFNTPTALLRLQAVGRRGVESLPRLRTTLEQQGPAAAAGALRALFTDQEFGRGMGAFSLKVMPHLIPPIEGDPVFWSSIFDELQVLAESARNAGGITKSMRSHRAA